MASAGSHQDTHGGATNAAFLAKFNSAGVRQWATYYGGTTHDIGYACSVDAIGSVYLSGETASGTGTVIATSGSHQSTLGGGGDAFLVKFDSLGVRQWGTYYGGIGNDIGRSCATDSTTGNVYSTGETDSNISSVIATTGSHQASIGGTTDAFLVKFNSVGIRQWGTYYGGSGQDYGYSCATNNAGNVYMSGYTSTSTNTILIATVGSHQTTLGGFFSNAFLAHFNSAGVRQWGTYYGGVGYSLGNSLASIGVEKVYLAGSTETNTGTVIATIGSHQPSYGGGSTDGFLVKFFNCINPASPTNLTPSPNQTICVNSTATLSAASGTAIVNWYPTPTSTVVLSTGTVYVTPTLSAGTYTYYASAITCAASLTRTAIKVTVNANPTITVSSGNICSGQSYTIISSGANTYTYSGGSSVISPTANASYTVVGTSTAGCISAPVVSNITVNITPTLNVNSGSVCAGESFTMMPSGANTYTFQGGTAVINPTATASYTVIGTSTAGCVSAQAVSSITVNPLPTLIVNASDSIICGPPFQGTSTLTANGANTYTWNPGGTVTSIAVSPSVTSTYSITGTDINGCINFSVFTLSVSPCSGINETNLAESEINIYPNPTTGEVTLESELEITYIKIVDLTGRVIFERKNIFSNQFAIDISEQQAGIYILEAHSDKNISRTKLIKN